MKMEVFMVKIIPLFFLQVLCMMTFFSSAYTSDTRDSSPQKLCALTFDDGPDVKLTALVLDRLEKYHVVASFFVIGQLINNDTKPVLDRELKLGCEINNHSWDWSGLDILTKAQVRDAVGKTSLAIEKVTGKAPKFFRPPNLAMNDALYETIDLPFASGVVGFDWAGCNTSAEERAQNVLNGMRDGAIILLHDVQPAPHPTPEALDILIPELQKQGYQFVTLSELFARKKIKLMPLEKKLWVYAE